MTSTLVLDSSAVMAILNAEPEGPNALAALQRVRDDGRILMPSVVLMEIEYLLLRKHSAIDTDRYMSAISTWPAEVMETFESWRRQAARVKAAGNISVVDAWVAALALLADGEVLHKDPQFDGVQGLRTIDIRRQK